MYKQIKNYCSPNITKRLLNALVLSRIDNCCSLFYGIYNSEVIIVHIIIRSSVRLIHSLLDFILPHLHSSDTTLLDLPVTRNLMRSRSFSSMAHIAWYFLSLFSFFLRKLKTPHVFSNSLIDYLHLKLK